MDSFDLVLLKSEVEKLGLKYDDSGLPSHIELRVPHNDSGDYDMKIGYCEIDPEYIRRCRVRVPRVLRGINYVTVNFKEDELHKHTTVGRS